MSEYLKRIPTSSGNRKVFTYSFWIKRNKLTDWMRLVSIVDGSTDSIIQLTNVDKLRFRDEVTAPDVDYISSRPLRDVGNWMHIVVSIDMTAIQAEHRIRMYINGVSLIEYGLDTESMSGTVNLELNFNKAGLEHRLFARNNDSEYFIGQVSDVFMVDGQALTPDVFGFNKEGKGYISAGSTQSTDFRPGQWLPKSPRVIKTEINRRGGFGVNGFYLPLNDQSNFGADHHMVPDTIIKLNTDLPQPKVSIASTTNAAGLAYTDVLRADPYADDLVLAVPGIGTIRDYSPFINSTLSGVGMTATIDNAGGGIDVGLGTVSAYYGEAIYKPVRDGSTIDYTPRTSTTAYGTQWTIEFWCNIEGETASYQAVYHHADAGSWNNGITLARNSGNDQWTIYANGTTSVSGGKFTSIFEHWQHIAAVRDGSKLSLFQNGVCVGFKTDYTGTDTTSAGREIGILGQPATNDYATRGYIQDLRVYIGTAKYDGGFDVPKLHRPVGVGTFREFPDTCTNNFATWNFLSNGSGTLSDGSLALVGNDGSSGATRTNATVAVSSGKWYFEVFLENAGAATDVGIAYNDITNNAPGVTNGGSGDYGYLLESGNTFNNNSSSSYGSSLTTGDTFMCAFDVDTYKLYFGKNGTWFGSSNPVTGSNPAFSITSGFSYRPVARPWAGGDADAKIQTNFGQNPTFSGQVTAGTYTDSNGRGLFKYAVPTGFLSLCEDNLPTSAVADPGEHFKCVLWTGDGNSGRGITGVGFKPDFVWLKKRNDTTSHNLTDSVRGIGNTLFSDDTSADNGNTARLQSFDSDGFSIGNHTAVNNNGDDFVAWCWKAGGAATANTDGSINSTVSANSTAGFSIITYSGNSTAGATVGHGLGKTPSMIIIKARDAARGWNVYHQDLGNTKYIQLQSSAAAVTDSGWWNDTSPNSSTFTLGTDNDVNGSGVGKYIAYCWAEIEGYSKFGSYVGNASADGTFVYCGFKPAFVMTKRTDGTSSWLIHDSSRDPVNPVLGSLYAHDTNAEGRASVKVDFVSNGFKHRNADGGVANNYANDYIFMAFAESPFQTANAK